MADEQRDPWHLVRLAQLATRQLAAQLDRMVVRHERSCRGARDRRRDAPVAFGEALPREFGGRPRPPLTDLELAGKTAATLTEQLRAAYRGLRDGVES